KAVELEMDLDKLTGQIRYSSSPEVRVAALAALPQLKGRSASELADTALVAAEDLVPGVRQAALDVLARLGVRSPAVLEAVRSLQKDGDAEVRERAGQVLSGLSALPGVAASGSH